MTAQHDLFDQSDDTDGTLVLGDGAMLLREFAPTAPLRDAIALIETAAAFRHMRVPRGGTMSVAITNCGDVGWVSDTRGYRYSPVDPLTNLPWPAIPALFKKLAKTAAARGGFAAFQPDACLINRYQPDARMGLHQDIDEADFAHPIVSVSIGASADFLWGGLSRKDKTITVPLHDGDVVVWGGASRRVYHGVKPLKSDAIRYNLTFRRAR
jgi:DNA oxidative demethylase